MDTTDQRIWDHLAAGDVIVLVMILMTMVMLGTFCLFQIFLIHHKLILQKLCLKFKYYGHTYGFGGLASLDRGLLPGKMVLKEHYRLGSSSVILSRSFCNIAKIGDMNEIRQVFVNGVASIRTLEDECRNQLAYFEDNKTRAADIIESIAEQMN